jgi:hypothetical protein
MIKSHYLKDFTYKGKKYSFIKPLRVRIESFICADFKTTGWELSIPDLCDGFTRLEPIVDEEKEIKKYIKSVFDDYLFKEDRYLDEYELEYKKSWIKMIKPPKQKKEK